ncbi:MAG: WD40/YVTN/BNR-like repeat-containing protein, partial [Terriglobales bacterium]
VYSLGPSAIAAGTIWAGTDDGNIQLTTNGGRSWNNVTPPALTAWSKVSGIEASYFDAGSAYASVDRHRLGDMAPYIYRTRDSGKSWQRISDDIPMGSYVNKVKSDPVRRGLLFAGTEMGVYVSFNDGDNWQPLQLNLPHTSARDFVIHENSLVVATHGRGFWVMDDISPLRQLNAAIADEPVHLFKPADALAVRQGAALFDQEDGTPLPPEEPQNPNPRTGAILFYSLRQAASQPITLEVLDANGKVVRAYHSNTPAPTVDVETLNIPAYWVKPPQELGTTAGLHRFVWDLRATAPPPRRIPGQFGAAAATLEIPGPVVEPGQYTLRLSVDGQTYTQPLTVKPDPRPGR